MSIKRNGDLGNNENYFWTKDRKLLKLQQHYQQWYFLFPSVSAKTQIYHLMYLNSRENLSLHISLYVNARYLLSSKHTLRTGKNLHARNGTFIDVVLDILKLSSAHPSLT